MQVSRIRLFFCSVRVAGTFVAFFPAFAQEVVSVVGGMIHHADGPFLVEGKEVRVDPGRRPQLQKAEKLETQDSQVEVMLVPDGFVRLAPNSSLEMVLTRADSARFRLHNGSALVDLKDVWDDESVSAVAGDVEILFRKAGLYRIDLSEGEPPEVKVFRGKARVEGPSGSDSGIMRLLSYTPCGVGAAGDLTQGSASLHPWATILRRFAAERPLSEQHCG